MDSGTDRNEPGNEVVPRKVYPRSVSQLKLYRACSLSWKFQKFDRIRSSPAAWLPQGTAFGGIAEQWELKDREVSLEEQKEIYYGIFDSEMAKYLEEQPDLSKWAVIGRTKIENDIKARRERGWDQWEVYRDRVQRESWRPWLLPDGTPAVEVKFWIDLGFGPLRGAIDIVKDWSQGVEVPPELTVNDLKTGNREKTPLQLAVYRVALNEMFGVDVTHGSFYYAKDDTYSDRYDLRTLGVEYLSGEFQAMERGIENRVFNANVGDACVLCPATSVCPEFQAMKR